MANSAAVAIVFELVGSEHTGDTSEHIYIRSEEVLPHSTAGELVVREELELRNFVRNTRTVFTLYEHGLMQVTEYRHGKRIGRYRLDLRYLDPVPTTTRVVTTRTLYAALVQGAAACSALLLAWLGVLEAVTVPLGAIVSGPKARTMPFFCARKCASITASAAMALCRSKRARRAPAEFSRNSTYSLKHAAARMMRL